VLFLQIQMRDITGFVATRDQLLQLKPSNRNHWITFAVAHHLNKSYEVAVQASVCCGEIKPASLSSECTCCVFCCRARKSVVAMVMLYTLNAIVLELFLWRASTSEATSRLLYNWWMTWSISHGFITVVVCIAGVECV